MYQQRQFWELQSLGQGLQYDVPSFSAADQLQPDPYHQGHQFDHHTQPPQPRPPSCWDPPWYHLQQEYRSYVQESPTGWPSTCWDLPTPYQTSEYHSRQFEYQPPLVQNQFAHDSLITGHSRWYQQPQHSNHNIDEQTVNPYYQLEAYQQRAVDQLPVQPPYTSFDLPEPPPYPGSEPLGMPQFPVTPDLEPDLPLTSLVSQLERLTAIVRNLESRMDANKRCLGDPHAAMRPTSHLRTAAPLDATTDVSSMNLPPAPPCSPDINGDEGELLDDDPLPLAVISRSEGELLEYEEEDGFLKVSSLSPMSRHEALECIQIESAIREKINNGVVKAIAPRLGKLEVLGVHKVDAGSINALAKPRQIWTDIGSIDARNIASPLTSWLSATIVFIDIRKYCVFDPGGLTVEAAIMGIDDETFHLSCLELIDGVFLIAQHAICASIKDMCLENGSIGKVKKVTASFNDARVSSYDVEDGCVKQGGVYLCAFLGDKVAYILSQDVMKIAPQVVLHHAQQQVPMSYFTPNSLPAAAPPYAAESRYVNNIGVSSTLVPNVVVHVHEQPVLIRVQEHHVSEQNTQFAKVAVSGEGYNPPTNGDLPTTEEEVHVSTVVDEVQDETESTVETPVIIDEGSEESYAPIVMHFKVIAATLLPLPVAAVLVLDIDENNEFPEDGVTDWSHSSYGFAKDEITRLFIVGFGYSMVLGSVAGSLDNQKGQKGACVTYCISYMWGCTTSHNLQYNIMMVGLNLGGIGTSLLFSPFESWLVAEYLRRGFEQEWLSLAFSTTIFLGNGFVAMGAGLFENLLVELRHVSSFKVAAVFLAIGVVVVLSLWIEDICNPLESKDLITLFKGYWDTKQRSFSLFVASWFPP